MGAFTGERVRILRMLEEGKVSVDEAARLLDALEGGGDGDGKAPRARRIRITVRESGLSPLHVTIPVGLVERLARLAEHASRPGAVSAEAIVRLVAEGKEDKLLEIEHGDQRIEIFAE